LHDEPRPGAARKITDAQVEAVLVKTLEETPANRDSHWSTRSMAKAIGLSQTAVSLLHRLPKPTLHSLRLLVRPDTVLRWHRDLVAHRHAALSRPRRPGRPRTIRSIRVLVLRLVAENPSWG
jgi:hypothetical protein